MKILDPSLSGKVGASSVVCLSVLCRLELDRHQPARGVQQEIVDHRGARRCRRAAVGDRGQTEAVLFRKIDRDHPSALFNESESIFGSRGDRYDGM
jgi:hypothetical protein